GVANTAPRAWRYDGTAWQRTAGGEDRLAFDWSLQRDVPIGDGPGTTGTGTCAVMCHTGVGERTLAGKLDQWQWRAGTTTPVGALEDGIVDATDGTGRKPDPGRTAPSDNVNAAGTGPLDMAEDDPGSRADFLVLAMEGVRRAVPFDPAATFRKGD